MTLKKILSIPVLISLLSGLVTATASNYDCGTTGLKLLSLTETSVKLQYTVKGLQVVEFGICCGKNPGPVAKTDPTKTAYEGDARDIPTDVQFKASFTGLDEGTTYYARAYMVSKGNPVCYSDEISFTTERSQDFSYLLNGPKTDYYPNGKIARTYNLENGAVNGSVKTYSDSGKIVSDQNVVNGIPEGFTRGYFPNGQISDELFFRNGIQTGPSKKYYPDGTLKEDNMCSGEPDRLTCQMKSYYENGGLKSESSMSNGEFVYAITYDREGRVTSEQKPGSIISYWYDDDGSKHTSINGEKCQCAKCNR